MEKNFYDLIIYQVEDRKVSIIRLTGFNKLLPLKKAANGIVAASENVIGFKINKIVELYEGNSIVVKEEKHFSKFFNKGHFQDFDSQEKAIANAVEKIKE